MPTFHDLIIRITIRALFEEDFAFDKNKEELALRIRSEYLPKLSEIWSIKQPRLSIDDDGDIELVTSKGTVYITKDTVWVATSLTTRSLVEKKDIHVASSVLDMLGKMRSLKAQVWGITINRLLRFKEDVVSNVLQSADLGMLKNKLPGGLSNSHVSDLKWSVSYKGGKFDDRLELEMEARRLFVRCIRISTPENFASFTEFVTQADIKSLVERMRPFVEPLITDPEKIRDNVFA